VHRERAAALVRRGDIGAGIALYESVLDAFEGLGERGQAAAVLGRLGPLYAQRGDPGRAIDVLERATAGHRAQGHALNEANCLRKLVAARGRSSVSEEDIADLRRAIDLAEEAHAPGFAATTRVTLGWLLHRRGELQAALETTRAAIGVQLRLGNPAGEASALLHLGTIVHAMGDPVGAREHHRRGLALCRGVDHTEGQAWALAELALIDAVESRLDDARNGLARAEDLFAGHVHGRAVVAVMRGVVAAREGNRAEARRRLEDAAREDVVTPGMPHAIATLRRVLAG
jgi:tetratricopeptide (TPR) repeat protein